MKTLLPLIAIAVFASACAHADRHRAPSSPVDRLLFFSEQDRRGDVRHLSGTTPVESTQLPDPAKVDVASIIQIRVNKGVIPAASPIDTDLEELARKAGELASLLDRLADVVDVNRRAAEAFVAAKSLPADDARLKAFVEMRREYGATEEKYNAALMVYFTEPHPKRKDLEKIVGNFEKEHAFIEAELREVEALRAVLSQAARLRAFRLKMWAAIEGSGGGPVHVEHYDTLTEGAIQYRDRWGLRLSDRERERLDRAMEATRRFADVAERVRRNEIAWRDALREAVAALTPRLTEIVDELDKLLQSAASWKVRFATLIVEVERVAPAAAKAAVEELKKSDPLFTALAALHADLKKFRDDSRTKTLPELITAAGGLVRSLKSLKEHPLDFREKAAAVAKAVGTAWQGSEAERLAKSFVEDAERAAKIVESAVELVRSLRSAPDPLPPTESLTVPVEDAKDTFIDLRRTGAIPKDVLTVKWELLEGDRVIDSSRASFEAQFFGHHASLEPSVILATPSRFEGGDSDGFHFAPALSWMHRYTPEPDDAGLIRAVLGFLDPAIGPHASFLNFDPDKEVEIGLGGTFSMWGDVVQIGIGYNLMAESTEEGGVYFFVGSSLIGLLQALGVKGVGAQ